MSTAVKRPSSLPVAAAPGSAMLRVGFRVVQGESGNVASRWCRSAASVASCSASIVPPRLVRTEHLVVPVATTDHGNRYADIRPIPGIPNRERVDRQLLGIRSTGRHDPLHRLVSDIADSVEVPVIVQNYQPAALGRGSNDQVADLHRSM